MKTKSEQEAEDAAFAAQLQEDLDVAVRLQNTSGHNILTIPGNGTDEEQAIRRQEQLL